MAGFNDLVRRLKNNTLLDGFWVGQLIRAGEYFELEYNELLDFIEDPKVEADLLSGDLILNDGSNDVTITSNSARLFRERSAGWLRGKPMAELVKSPSAESILRFDEATGEWTLGSLIDGIAGGFHDVFHFGEGSKIKDKFMKSSLSNHTSLDSSSIAMFDGEVVHVAMSTEKTPKNNWFLQIIQGAIKDEGSAPFQGGTQVGTDLEKLGDGGANDNTFLDIRYYNLTGFTFSQGDRIAVYVKAGTEGDGLDKGKAIEPAVSLYVKYSNFTAP